MLKNTILIRNLGLQPYENVMHAMHNFNHQRNNYTPDELWLVEHLPVFTQGQRNKEKNITMIKNIPVIQSDRGGKITYHGPGQQIMYVLIDLKRRKLKIHDLIMLLEQTVIDILAKFGINSYSCINAPGIYVNKMKICSMGLRISRGCSLHGLALNVAMDLSPFLYIDPCGISGMQMTHMLQWIKNITINKVRHHLVTQFLILLNNLSFINYS